MEGRGVEGRGKEGGEEGGKERGLKGGEQEVVGLITSVNV